MFKWHPRAEGTSSPEQRPPSDASVPVLSCFRGGNGWRDGRSGINTGADCDFGRAAAIAGARGTLGD